MKTTLTIKTWNREASLLLVLFLLFNTLPAVAQTNPFSGTSEILTNAWKWIKGIMLFALVVSLLVTGIKVYGVISGSSSGEQAEKSMYSWIKGIVFIALAFGVLAGVKALFSASTSDSIIQP